MRETCLKQIYELAKHDPRIVFIGSDLGAGVLDEMRQEMPERFFMEGVCEANIIGMAAGLAMDGFIPYVNTIATFLTRRCYEQVAVDLCLHNLPVRLIANGGGLVYAPLGPTHMTIEDIAIMRALPHMTVVAPVDADEMVRLMAQTPEWPGPMYVRLGKGYDPVSSRPELDFAIGRGIAIRPVPPAPPGRRVLAVSTGVMTTRALAAADTLTAAGAAVGVLHMHTVKPLDVALLLEMSRDVDLVATIEEHSLIGGLGSAVTDALAFAGQRTATLRLALPDAFPDDYGSQDHLLEQAGLQPSGIASQVLDALSRDPLQARGTR